LPSPAYMRWPLFVCVVCGAGRVDALPGIHAPVEITKRAASSAQRCPAATLSLCALALVGIHAVVERQPPPPTPPPPPPPTCETHTSKQAALRGIIKPGAGRAQSGDTPEPGTGAVTMWPHGDPLSPPLSPPPTPPHPTPTTPWLLAHWADPVRTAGPARLIKTALADNCFELLSLRPPFPGIAKLRGPAGPVETPGLNALLPSLYFCVTCVAPLAGPAGLLGHRWSGSGGWGGKSPVCQCWGQISLPWCVGWDGWCGSGCGAAFGA
jgi:hypothetical protein